MRVLALVVGVVVTTGCASSRTTSAGTSAVAEPTVAQATATPATTEAATGELRQAILQLRRVHFAYNQATLLPSARQALTAAADTLKKHPDVIIYIEGHADHRGSADYNLALSRERAEAVVRFLVGQGVDARRLQVGSYGLSRPLARGSDPTALAKNRRADFRLIRGDVELVVESGVLVDDAGRPLPAGNAASR